MKKTYITPQANIVKLPQEEFVTASSYFYKIAGGSYYEDDDENGTAPTFYFGGSPFHNTFD